MEICNKSIFRRKNKRFNLKLLFSNILIDLSNLRGLKIEILLVLYAIFGKYSFSIIII